MPRRWEFMTIEKIIDIADPTDVYMWRLRIFTTPLCSLKLHHIMRPDNDRHLHDHPWNFHSLILKGGYTEIVDQVPEGHVQPVVNKKPGHWSHKKATDAHRIAQFNNRKDSWSLVFCGRIRRKWGFWVDGVHMPHEEYLDLRDRGLIDYAE